MPTEVPKLRDVPDAHLRAIGLVSLHWSVLETVAFRMALIMSTMETDECRAAMAHMSFPQKLDFLCTLVDLLAPGSAGSDAIKRFAENELRKSLSAKRASIVHLDWWPDDSDPKQIKATLYKAHGRLQEHPLTMTEGQILAIAEEIHNKTIAFAELFEPLLFPALNRRKSVRAIPFGEPSPDKPA